MRVFTLSIILLSAVYSTSHSIFLIKTTQTCAFCSKQDTFLVINTRHPSHLHQYIDWVYTQTYSINTCLRCRFTTFNFDFDKNIPEGKRNEIDAYLKTVKFRTHYKDYTEIPLTLKLNIAEKIYQILGRDVKFWCDFYRILGYCYEEENKKELSKAARMKSLALAPSMLTNDQYKGKEKEVLYTIATLQYVLGHEDSTLVYLGKAKETTYVNSSLSSEDSKARDEYLSDLINEFPEYMKEQKSLKKR